MAVFKQQVGDHTKRFIRAVGGDHWQFFESDYHLVVIGAGTAGLVTAAGAASLGARVALIERELMGGDHIHTSCSSPPSQCSPLAYLFGCCVSTTPALWLAGTKAAKAED